ncbi:peptide/nickel transport system permease protein [Filimonas lacunae]|uniref:Peptide/nickel transport system permease protein n=1 Tax=Filimonas lacunae TaxID=477680 RepID=A0A173MKC8_9BACT|nr:ABC transporter permease [Filimonas lacunae]BAV08093.1 oligopeptide transport system permease protein OppB [Filimonas lacunae]SIT09219.1 peptide/nickel transport system permease protein [Filimonas lacunae]
MLQLLLRKSIYGLLVLVGVVMLVFVLFQGFGDPARLVLGQTGDSATIQNIRKELALDQPRWKQFLLYANDVSPISIYTADAIQSKQLKGFFIGGNTRIGVKLPYLRRSYQTKRNVSDMLLQALPQTIVLACIAMCIATIVGILLGILAAVKQNTWWDGAAIFTSILGISAPSFFMGIVLAYIFGFVLSDYTGLHMTGSLFEVDTFTGEHLQLRNVILPAITLGIRPLAVIAQLTRSAMLDVLDQDYIRTAYAKGLTRWQVITRHALRNALNPVVTAITGWFAELLAGAFFVEYIFGWNGIGKMTVDALEKLDFPVVMGSVLVTASCFIVVNLLADLLYGIIDPRVRIN